jgi:predicted N-acetyltransferase YhbS
MKVELRAATPADFRDVARINFEAFAGIADRHNFPRDFASVNAAMPLAEILLNHGQIYGVVATEGDGKIVGSNFLWEMNEIRGVGPITVDPNAQAKGVGRMLMQDVIERGKDAPGIRLVQDAFNRASMSLYANLGFDVKEPLVLLEGKIAEKSLVGENVEVRSLAEEDFAACDALHQKIHGFSRLNELKDLSRMMPGYVAVRGNEIVAYASCPHMWQMNHAVAETSEDLQVLLAGASSLSNQPLSFLLPTRQTDLFRWCLKGGMRIAKPMTLMTMGFYQEPQRGDVFLPSVLY